jgi:hypothetical protein
MNDKINSRVDAISLASIRKICKTIIKFKIIARTVKVCMTIANFLVKRKNWVLVPAQVGRRGFFDQLTSF